MILNEKTEESVKIFQKYVENHENQK